MAWSFTDLKYGWKIAAGISLAAVTIFVVNNERERVNQADIIELALGTHERCLATQYATNPATYYVASPSFVRSWYSNSYVTTNVPGDPVTNWTAQLWTNTFTNVIGWRSDRAMMASLDSTIKALVPYYADINTVYAGTTNISMLTVTGLWASLGIGDGTNQFTSVPAIGTNEATYGAYPWRVYKEDLEERYKVLNALRYSKINVSGVYTGFHNDIILWNMGTNWDTAKNTAETGQNPLVIEIDADFTLFTYGVVNTNLNEYMTFLANHRLILSALEMQKLTTNVTYQTYFFVKPTLPFGYAIGTSGAVFDDNGLGLLFNTWNLIISTNNSLGTLPAWCAEPSSGTSPLLPDVDGYGTDGYGSSRGLQINRENQSFVLDYNFLYCTNKYW